MPQACPLTLLLVNEQAEEVKLTTICMRGFYPGCRVEAVYSSEEALEWAAKQDWHVILLDEQLPHRSGFDILPELRRHAPYAAIIVQTARMGAEVAAQAAQAGADSYLFKKSPAFFTELPLVTKAALERRDLRMKLDRAERYLRLIEDMTDGIYELDSEGRFVHASPNLLSRLGYSEQELMGVHYAKIIHPDDHRTAEHRFNERRTDARASRKVALRLLIKQQPSNHEACVEIDLDATGLYDQHQHFLGTLGTARETTGRKQEQTRLRLLEEQLRQVQKIEALAPAIKQVADKLTPPLTTILADAARLLKQIQDLQIEQHLQGIHVRASPAAQAASEAASAVQAEGPVNAPDTVQQSDRDRPVEAARFPERPASREAKGSTPAEQVVPPRDRRRAPRVNRSIEVRLTQEGSSWKGVVLNISRGGLYMIFDSSVPAAEGQPIQLGIASEVGVLEIHGIVRGVREAVGFLVAPPTQPALGLAVEFMEIRTAEELILASFLDELRGGALGIKVSALLTPPETGDLLLEVPSTDPEAIQTRTSYPSFSPFMLEEFSTGERRQAVRATLSIPARIESGGASPSMLECSAFTSDISLGGACIHLQAPSNLVGQRFLLHLPPPRGHETRMTSTLTETVPITVTGEIVWTAPDAAAPLVSKDGLSSMPLRVGIRFLLHSTEGKQRIAELADRCLISPARAGEETEDNLVESESLECRNQRGQRVAAYYDHPRKTLLPGSPLAIISPGYGETKKDYVALSYYLASNGFHVLRYDHTNHVGESDGDMQQSTLSGMTDDLRAILDYAERTWPACPVAVLAAGVAGRAALKAAQPHHRIMLLVLLSGVLDVQAVLRAAYGTDLVGCRLHGTQLGVLNLFGFNVDADHWLEDAVKNGYGNLPSAIKDAEQLHIPVKLFTAVDDIWVKPESVQAVQEALGDRGCHWELIPDVLQRLCEGPEGARKVLRQLASCCVHRFYPFSHAERLQEPTPREVSRQAYLERERARIHHLRNLSEQKEFWQTYLARDARLADVTEYWHFLSHLCRLMGPIGKGTRILDAGCGNGHIGMYLSLSHAYHRRATRRDEDQPAHYVGIDFIPDACARARVSLTKVMGESNQRVTGQRAPTPPLTTSLCLADLNNPLPFKDNQFDRVLCNLVIGLVWDPILTIRELIRVLSPDGRLILTNFNPFANLSQVSLAATAQSGRSGEQEAMADLLLNWGMIHHGERQGLFRFFTRQQLVTLLHACGVPHPRITTAFANQAFVAVFKKSAIMGNS